VVECLSAGVPFLASHAGGIPELIADPDVDRVTFAPEASELANILGRALREGVSVARPATDAEENVRRWVAWHSVLASRPVFDHGAPTQIAPTQTAAASVKPLVTVCLKYRGGGAALLHAVESLRRQNWPNLEVILYDSTKALHGHPELDGLRSDFESRGWQVISAAECSSKITRATAVARARGEYVLFMDGADWAHPDAVATFVAVAAHTGADILTCFLVLFSGTGEPTDESVTGHSLFLGAAVLLGVFHNHFGSGCVFVRKQGFSRLAGHRAEDRPENRKDCADWEFLARAALMGSRLEVVPRPLLWSRVPDDSISRLGAEYDDHFRAITPYVEAMPFALRELPSAALTMKMQYERQYGLANSNGTLPSFSDEQLTVLLEKRLAAHGNRRLSAVLRAWLEYGSARRSLPPGRLQRIPLIARQLFRGRYHRFGHGFGSALRDLRRPALAGYRRLVTTVAESVARLRLTKNEEQARPDPSDPPR